MALNEQEFSDLILLPGELQAVLKGVPGHGRELVPVRHEDEAEVDSIRTALGSEYYRSREEMFRFRHDGRNYRVARYQDIDLGETYFLRRLPLTVPDFSGLGLPDAVLDWLLSGDHQHGLVLFCGAQASGKTTTASSYTKARLEMYGGHAITYEIPVEMPLAGQHGEFGRCFQQELEDEADLMRHIERSHRYGSPNIVYIGEIRSKYAASEVLRVALGSSEQLVVSTLHGLDIVTALERLIGWAREIDGGMAAHNLAQSLLAIVRLDLVSDGDRKALAMPEFLLVPFRERQKGVRAKIRDGKLAALENDITEQRNMALMNRLGEI